MTTQDLHVRRFQHTDLGAGKNHEVILSLTPVGDGWCGHEIRGRIGASGRGQRRTPLTFATSNDLECHVEVLQKRGFVETALVVAAEEASPGDDRVDQLLEWMFRAANEHIASFLRGAAASLDLAQLDAARQVYNEICDLWDLQRQAPSLTRKAAIAELVNRFYSLIPTKLPKRIRLAALVDDFTSMLPTIGERLDQLAGTLATLTATGSGRIAALGASLTPMGPQDAEWPRVAAFLDRRLEREPHYTVRGVFRVCIPEVEARWVHATRGKERVELCCHGSPAYNWRHILAGGLRLPRVAAHGWALGAGIYFGDVLGKSMGYVGTRTRPGDPHGVLLCDVAVGRAYETGSYGGRTAPEGYDSIFSPARAGWAYNERVIFDEAQHCPRYFVAVE